MWSATPLKWFLTSSPAEDGPYWLIRPCAQTTSFSQGEQYYAIRPVFVSKAQRACSMVASKGFGRGRPTVECELTSYSQAEGAGGGDNTGILIQPVIDGCLCVCWFHPAAGWHLESVHIGTSVHAHSQHLHGPKLPGYLWSKELPEALLG